jgi:hypothetical protein
MPHPDFVTGRPELAADTALRWSAAIRSCRTARAVSLVPMDVDLTLSMSVREPRAG